MQNPYTTRMNPSSDRISVQIDEVVLAERKAFCIDKTGASISAYFHAVSGGAFRIPKAGEWWTIIRSGWSWNLDRRLDTYEYEQTTLEDLNPGDTRIHADGTIRMLGTSVQINNMVVGGTVLDVARHNGSGSFVLTATPVHGATVQVYVENNFLHQGIDYDVSGRIITFTSPPSFGDRISVYFQRMGMIFEDSEIASGASIPVASVESHSPCDGEGFYCDSAIAFGASEIVAEEIGPWEDHDSVSGVSYVSHEEEYEPA